MFYGLWYRIKHKIQIRTQSNNLFNERNQMWLTGQLDNPDFSQIQIRRVLVQPVENNQASLFTEEIKHKAELNSSEPDITTDILDLKLDN